VAHWADGRFANIIARNHAHDAAAQERAAFARQCLIEANRTLDPEVADTLRKLAERYFNEADGQLPPSVDSGDRPR
jgi:hypothetical protein